MEGARRASVRAGAGLAAEPDGATTTEADIQQIISTLGNLATVIRDAGPAAKAKVFAGLNLRLTYQPGSSSCVRKPSSPLKIFWGYGSCPRGDLNPHALAGTSTSS